VEQPNRLLAAALEIQGFCERESWRFCFIGGIAVQHWGEARLTRDADLTIFTGIGDESLYADKLLAQFASRVDDARDFALRQRVLLLQSASGIPLDISLGALPFEERAVTTASFEEVAPGVRLRLCSASALVIFKAFAGRAQDWLDIEGIAAKSAQRLDWGMIRSEAGALLDLKEDRAALERLEAIARRNAQS
jgi:hypothetical protein